MGSGCFDTDPNEEILGAALTTMDDIRMESVPNCILCGRAGTPLYRKLPDRLFGMNGLFRINRCGHCRLLWLDPRPSAADLSKCYKTYYTHSEIAQDQKDPPPRPLASVRDALRVAILCGYYGYRHLSGQHLLCRLGPLMAKIPFLRYRAVYDDLRERFPHYRDSRDNLLIDIGCGHGDYLKRMKDLGWNVLGIEPDPVAAALTRQQGIPVVNGTLADAGLPEGTADQITLQHVIEHLPDPLAAVRECYRLLKKEGRLVIYTPNNQSLGHRSFGSSWYALDPPRHFFVFSPTSMALLFQASPFREWRIRTVSVSAAKIYDNSSLISKQGRIAGNVTAQPQRWRSIFASAESLLCLLGLPYGEEVEAIAYRC